MRTDRLCGEMANFIANVEKLIFLLDGTLPRQDIEPDDIEGYTSADPARVPTPPGASFVGEWLDRQTEAPYRVFRVL